MTSVIDDRQTAGTIVMVRPRRFGANPQTMKSNAFQRLPEGMTDDEIAGRVASEFNAMVESLGDAGVEVIVFDDVDEPEKPDAVFPNNWVSFHADGTVILYPMEAENRRAERRLDIVESLSGDHGFFVRDIIDLSALEDTGVYLEGTGSLVLDRVNRQAYAALSSRTGMDALAEFSQRTGYSATVFDVTGPKGLPIYHTNVMMGIGEKFAVICAEAITDTNKREDVLARLGASGRAVIQLTIAQLQCFAGNLLELSCPGEESLIVISQAARAALAPDQLAVLESCAPILAVDVATIEAAGGGSVRCMMAEIFLPRPGHSE